MVINLNSTQDLLKGFARRLMDACENTPEFLQGGFSVSVGGFGIGIAGRDMEEDPVSTIEKILRKLKKDGKRLLVTLDEVLDDFVYRKIWEELSAQEKRIVKAMPEGKIKVGNLCGTLSLKSEFFSKYRDRLLKKGVLSSPQYGYVELLLPRLSIIARHYD